MSRCVDLDEKVTAQFYDQEHEKWIKEDRGGVEYTAVWSDVEYFRYCPNCWAKMEEQDEQKN